MVPQSQPRPFALARAFPAILAGAVGVTALALAIGAADTLALLVGVVVGLSAGVAGVVYQPDRAGASRVELVPAPEQKGGR